MNQQDCLLGKSANLGTDVADILKLTEFVNILLRKRTEDHSFRKKL